MRLSPDEILEATGYPLSQPQARALESIHTKIGAVNPRSARVLRNFGFVTYPDPYTRKLTERGYKTLMSLYDACEYAPSVAKLARLTQSTAHEAYLIIEQGV